MSAFYGQFGETDVSFSLLNAHMLHHSEVICLSLQQYNQSGLPLAHYKGWEINSLDHAIGQNRPKG